ncbi:MAG TPA: sigma-70 family RNA polymerase sigma factor [Bryobacteraceae bacterium]|jgi:RNA polymerase sigma-70 factor (ECF subfamily)|nr:sigma-70 family RNA polymerase sigma factor [Bryobacteraceae bacterium]
MSPDAAQLEAHRTALTGHCYRMLGSAFDADDAVQETMLRAWRSIGQFDGRASVRTWLYRIATNVCLDELKDRGRRARPMEEGSPSSGAPPLECLAQLPGSHWLEPIADARVIPPEADPGRQAVLRQSIRLAFVAALQNLPPKQRAILLLSDVLELSAAEIAEMLETSVAAVNSALQRARTSLPKAQTADRGELSESQRELLSRYVAAFERYDVDALTALMRQDATFCMPPYSLWLQGPEAVRTWMLGIGSGCRGSRLIPTAACGSPAFAQYRPDPDAGYRAWALIVLELADDRIAGVNSFLDTTSLFPAFGLPLTLGS